MLDEELSKSLMFKNTLVPKKNHEILKENLKKTQKKPSKNPKRNPPKIPKKTFMQTLKRNPLKTTRRNEKWF